MLRVLLVHASFGIGGTETQLRNMVKYADRSQVQFEVAWTYHSPGVRYEAFKELGVPLHGVRDTKLLVGFNRRLEQLIRSRRYDAVAGFCPQNIGRVVQAAHACGVPSRLACYRSASKKLNWHLARSAYMLIDRWLAMRHATRLLGNSPAVLDGIFPHRNRQSDRYRVIPNGLEPERFNKPIDRDAVRRQLGIDPQDLVIGHIGRFAGMKNHRTIIRVAAELARRFDRVRLLLVGDGDMKASIMNDLRETGMLDHAILTGVRADVPEMLACMDLFLFLSLHEGLPNSLLEAMAAGVPFVASDIAPNFQAVPPAGRQYLAGPKDIRRLTELATELLNDRGRREELSAACREHVNREYTVQNCLGKFLQTIRADLQAAGQAEA